MSWVAAAIGGGALLGAITSSDSSRKASNTQADAANNAQQLQLDMFNRNKADSAPWLTGGQNANTALQNLLGLGPNGSFDPNAMLVKPFDGSNFQTDPSYQWRLGQGENALLNKASALGGLGGGNTMKALQEYGQGAASQEYNNAFTRYNTDQQNIYSRLSGLSNTGANSALGIAGIGANAAYRAGDFGTQAANAQAAGTIGQSNALNSGISGLTSAWLYANAQQQGQVPSQPNRGSVMNDLQAQAAFDPYYGNI